MALQCLEQRHKVEKFVRRYNTVITFWNGEDIFQSLVSFKQSGLPNRSYKLPVAEVDNYKNMNADVAISKASGHIYYRSRFLRHAIRRLDLKEQALMVIRSNTKDRFREILMLRIIKAAFDRVLRHHNWRESSILHLIKDIRREGLRSRLIKDIYFSNKFFSSIIEKLEWEIAFKRYVKNYKA